MLRKIGSYFIPIRLRSYSSSVSGTLEINYSNGKKILDTATSNYSYGSLKKILHKGLQAVSFNPSFKNILVLGMGGGSVVSSIREDFLSDAPITLVEIDPTAVAIAKNEFNIQKRYKNIHIVEADANTFVDKCTKTFDLVIVDIFIIDTIPDVFTKAPFLQKMTERIQPNGKLIFNTMRDTIEEKERNQLLHHLKENRIRTEVLKRVAHTNDLIIGTKE